MGGDKEARSGCRVRFNTYEIIRVVGGSDLFMIAMANNCCTADEEKRARIAEKECPHLVSWQQAVRHAEAEPVTRLV